MNRPTRARSPSRRSNASIAPNRPPSSSRRERVLRVVWQAGVVDPLDAGLVGKPRGDGQGVVALAGHPQRERLQATMRQPGLVGAEHRAQQLGQVVDLLPVAASAAATVPPVTSPWPPMYLVALWTTRSAPCSTGRSRYGEANVLSTTVLRAGPACAKLTSAARSSTLTSGLEIVSR